MRYLAILVLVPFQAGICNKSFAEFGGQISTSTHFRTGIRNQELSLLMIRSNFHLDGRVARGSAHDVFTAEEPDLPFQDRVIDGNL